MSKMEWRMGVAIPLAYTAISFLNLNNVRSLQELARLDDDELTAQIQRVMPIHKMDEDEQRVLLEEVRVLLPQRWEWDY